MPSFRTLLPLAVLLVAVALTRADEVRTLGNKTLSGTVVGVTDKDITIRTESGPVTTPLSEVLSLDLLPIKGMPAGAKYSEVRLLDETVLLCTKVAFKAKQVALSLPSGQEVKLPLDYVVSILHGAENPALRKQWEPILSARDVKRDRIIVLKDEELVPIEGTFGDVDPKGENIQFRLEGGAIRSVPFERMQGLTFYRTEAPAASAVCQVFDVQGNSLAAKAVALDGKRFKVTTVGGIEVAYEQNMIARFDYNLGKLTFLSDMTPSRVVEKSGVGLPVAYRKDVNLDGDQILLGEKTFPKGLSLHAHTELEYSLGGKYKEFRAVLGVDPRVGAESKARVTIEADGEKLFSEEVTAAMAPRPLVLPLRKASRLRVTVSSSNVLDLHDHVTLADAKVSQ